MPLAVRPDRCQRAAPARLRPHWPPRPRQAHPLSVRRGSFSHLPGATSPPTRHHADAPPAGAERQPHVCVFRVVRSMILVDLGHRWPKSTRTTEFTPHEPRPPRGCRPLARRRRQPDASWPHPPPGPIRHPATSPPSRHRRRDQLAPHGLGGHPGPDAQRHIRDLAQPLLHRHAGPPQRARLELVKREPVVGVHHPGHPGPAGRYPPDSAGLGAMGVHHVEVSRGQQRGEPPQRPHIAGRVRDAGPAAAPSTRRPAVAGPPGTRAQRDGLASPAASTSLT